MSGERAEVLRLFVALELPGSWPAALGQLQEALQRELALPGRGLRWTRPEGIHLTLKFLGEVAAARRPAIEAALASGLVGAGPLTLRPGRLGSFGGRRPRLLWLGLDGDLDRLGQLAAAVEAGLAPLGFPRETRPFAAHLTLARVPDDLPPPAVARVARLPIDQPAGLDVPDAILETVSLIRSQLGPGGARYERLLDVSLR